MDSAYIFSIAAQRTDYLARRQSIVAENVANADTPGYTARDIAPFEEVLDRTGLAMRSTNAAHLASLGGSETVAAGSQDQTPWDVSHSGNSVSLEQEMLKAGEIARSYSLDTSVMKKFHQMLIMSTGRR